MKIELAHDSLAKKIYDTASAEDKMYLRISNFITSRYKYYLDTGILLNQEDLDYISPHVKKITLGDGELVFVRQSYKRAERWAKGRTLGLITTAIILVGFGVWAVIEAFALFRNFELNREARAEIQASDQTRKIAKQEATQLLTRRTEIKDEDLKSLNKMEVLRQLIIQYDTLAQQRTTAQQERDLAQSATLSDLAEKALDQDDHDYAFQLAQKAWELNEHNEQAIEILEELSETEVSFAELPEEEVMPQLKQASVEKDYGTLDEEAVEAIFSRENLVLKRVTQQVTTQASSSVKGEIKKLINTKGPKLKPGQHPKEPIISKVITPDDEKKNSDDNQNQQQQQIQQVPVDLPPPTPEPITEPIQQQQTIDPSTTIAPPSQVQQQQEPPRFAPRGNSKIDCILAQRGLKEWLPLREKRNYTLYIRYRHKNQFYLGIDVFASKEPFPNFNAIEVAYKDGSHETFPIEMRTPVQGKIVYLTKPLVYKEKLKTVPITAITFLERPKKRAYSEGNPYRVLLSSKTQNQLLTLNRCLL